MGYPRDPISDHTQPYKTYFANGGTVQLDANDRRVISDSANNTTVKLPDPAECAGIIFTFHNLGGAGVLTVTGKIAGHLAADVVLNASGERIAYYSDGVAWFTFGSTIA